MDPPHLVYVCVCVCHTYYLYVEGVVCGNTADVPHWDDTVVDGSVPNISQGK